MIRRIVVLLLVAFTSCLPENSTDHEINHDKINKVVLIFSNNPSQDSEHKRDVFSSNRLIYYNDSLIRKEYDLKNQIQKDTLTIYTNRNSLPFDISYNNIGYSYLCKQGDTVTFSFGNKYPFISSINRTSTSFDLNYSLFYKKQFHKPLAVGNTLILLPEISIQKIFTEHYSDYKIQRSFLDSLKKENLLSNELFQIYNSQNDYEFVSMALFDKQYASLLEKIPTKFSINKLINDDHLLYHEFFHRFLIWQYLWSNLSGIPKIKHSQGVTLNYRTAYDIVKTDVKNEHVRNYLLFYCLEMIKEEDSSENFISYFSKFKSDVKDKTYSFYLKQDIEGQKAIKSDELSILTNMSKTQRLEYSHLIQGLKGNVIYVDFWASWCMPCRAAMPSSRELKNTYKGKAVTFIYISIDNNYEKWKKAINDENLTNEVNSYFLLDSKKAGLIKQLSLTSIPRYLIYNKQGILMNKNAPGPNGTDTYRLIDKYLSQ